MRRGIARATIVRLMVRVATDMPSSVRGPHFSLWRNNHTRRRTRHLRLEGSRRQAVRHLGPNVRR